MAAACQQVTLQESGQLGLSPLASPGNFYPDLLKRVGVEMEVFGRGKYKSAPNRFTERKFTAADREQRQRLLDNMWDHVATQIGEARKLSADVVRKLADDGPLLASEALAEGLVDRVAYPDQVVADAKERVGKKATLLYLPLYKKRAGKGRRPGKTVDVAVIRAVGTIERTESLVPIPGLSSGPSLSPDKVVPQIRAARERQEDQGSGVAHRQSGRLRAGVGHHLARTRLAARGGQAVGGVDGVGGGVGRLLHRRAGQPHRGRADHDHRLDRRVRDASRHRRRQGQARHPHRRRAHRQRAAGQPRPQVDAQAEEAHRRADRRGVRAVPRPRRQGPHMQTDAVLEVAGGRVWTGADAVEAGLVDDLGGLDKAIEVAVELSGAAAGTRAKVRPFPKKSNALGRCAARRARTAKSPPPRPSPSTSAAPSPASPASSRTSAATPASSGSGNTGGVKRFW